MNQTKNTDMKAEEIYRKWKGYNSEYHLTTSDLQNISAMKEYAFQFQSPQISEEEIDAWIEKYTFRVPYDGSNNFYDEVAGKHCEEMKKWILSCLPHEQPVGKTDTLEVEQQGEEPLDIDEHIVK